MREATGRKSKAGIQKHYGKQEKANSKIQEGKYGVTSKEKREWKEQKRSAAGIK